MDELPPKAAALLRAARRDHDPSRADSERVRTALAATLAAPALHAERGLQAERTGESALRAGKGASGLFSSTFAKLLVTLGLLGGAALGVRGVVLLARGTARAPAQTQAAASTRSALGAQTAPETAHASETDAPNRPPAEATAREVAPEPPALLARSTHLRKRSAPLARASASDPEATSERETAPVRNDNGELALMRAALARLNGGEAREALTLLDQHAARYPDGVLREERAGLRAVALCKMGDLTQGSAAQQEFLRTYAGSPMAARVQQACREQGR